MPGEEPDGLAGLTEAEVVAYHEAQDGMRRALFDEEYRADAARHAAEEAELEEKWLEEQKIQREFAKKRAVWDAARNGHRSITAAAMRTLPREKPDAFLDNLIYPGSLLILAGSPKAGKSTFLFYALQAITTGQPFCGLKTRLGKVLYASEQPDASLDFQIDDVPGYEKNENISFIPLDFNYTGKQVKSNDEHGVVISTEEKRSAETWVEQIAVWKEELAYRKAEIFVIDTFTAFGLFKTGEAFDSGPVTTRLQQLKSLQTSFPGLAIVVCHHLRKEDEQHKKKEPSFQDIANSYALVAASDMNAIIWKPSGKQEDENLRSIKIQGRFLKQGEKAFSVRKKGTSFDVSEPPKKVDHNDRILKAIKAEPELNKLSLSKLADAVDVHKSAAQRFRNAYPKNHPEFQEVKGGT
jgi:hypothetical protein